MNVVYAHWVKRVDINVFPTAKKKGTVLNRKIGHCECMKRATFSEMEHFSFAIKQLKQADWAF